VAAAVAINQPFQEFPLKEIAMNGAELLIGTAGFVIIAFAFGALIWFAANRSR
jgi:hypothetical protein